MAKKRKKIRRSQTPPLSWVDKASYWTLFLLVISSTVLFAWLVSTARARIAYQDPTVLAFRGRQDYLWIVPLCTFLLLGCAIPLICDYEEGQPIFGNKAITYGEQPWPKDLYPVFGPQHRKIERTPYAKQMHRLGQIAWVAGLVLVLLAVALCLCRRNTLRSDQTIAVYDSFNRQTAALSIPNDCTELVLAAECYSDGRYGSTKWRYKIKLRDARGRKYEFCSYDFRGNQSDILSTMLQIKRLFQPESISIEGVDELEHVIDWYHLNSEESSLLLELFE